MTEIAWVDTPSEDQIRAARPSGGPYDFGFVPAMGRLLAAHPRIGPPFFELFAEIMFAPGSLSRRERELVAGIAAATQDCFY